VNIADQYNIGINLLVNGEALEMFTKFSRTTSEINKKIDVMNRAFLKLNDTMDITSQLFHSILSASVAMGSVSVRSISAATDAMRAFNMEAREGGRFASRLGTRVHFGHRIYMGGAGGARAAESETGGFLTHAGRHLGKDAGREMGTAGKLGMGGLMDAAFGVPGMIVGGAAYMGVKGFEANNTYQRTLAQISGQGFAGFTGKANAAAMGSNIPMVSKTQYLEAINDALIVTKNQQGALGLAPTIARMNAGNTIVAAHEGRRWTEEDSYKIARASEILSHSRNPKKIAATMNELERAMSIEGFKLSPSDIYTYAKRNASFASVQDQTAFLANVVGMQQAGGATWGTMGRTFTNMMLRGQPFGTGRFAMMRQMNMGIMGSNFEPIHKNQLVSDPAEWILNVLNPILDAHGYKTMKQKATEIPRLFSGTSGNYIMQTLGIASKIQGVLHNVGNAKDVKGVFSTALSLPSGSIKNLSAAWTNLEIAFGKLSSPLIIAGIKALTVTLNGLADTFGFFAKGGKAWKLLNEGTDKIIHKIGRPVINRAAENLSHVTVNLDGKKVGGGIFKAMNPLANVPSSSGNHVHTNLSLTQTGNNHHPVGNFG